MTPAERAAIRAFLEYIADNSDDPVESQEARDYLRDAWAKEFK